MSIMSIMSMPISESNILTVYKSAGSYHDHIVTLEIDLNDPEIRTNLNRTNYVFDKNHVKYRTNKAKVIDIIHKETKQKTSKIQSKHKSQFIYEIGQYVNVDDYNNDLNFICGTGIHFFLSYESALCYLYRPHNEKYQEWYDDGKKHKEMFYKDGKLDGRYIKYYNNGEIQVQTCYNMGKFDGLFEEWYENKQIKFRASYIMGQFDGKYERFDKSGKRIQLYHFKNGKIIKFYNVKKIFNNLNNNQVIPVN